MMLTVPELVLRDVDHVRAILACAEDPVDLVRLRIVAANRLRCFGREPGLAANIRKSMGTAQRTEIDGGECFLRNKVNDCQRVEGSRTIVRNVCQCAVGRGNHLMRVVAYGHFPDNLQA
jgi:hypothetical protein